VRMAEVIACWCFAEAGCPEAQRVARPYRHTSY
jgi:hypothetical protein